MRRQRQPPPQVPQELFERVAEKRGKHMPNLPNDCRRACDEQARSIQQVEFAANAVQSESASVSIRKYKHRYANYCRSAYGDCRRRIIKIYKKWKKSLNKSISSFSNLVHVFMQSKRINNCYHLK